VVFVLLLAIWMEARLNPAAASPDQVRT
jgi:hypothetical protein